MRRYLYLIFFAFLHLLLPAAVTAQTVPEPAPKAAETAPSPPEVGPLELNMVMLVRDGAEVRVASGAVNRGEALVSIPFKYRRTAELTEDLVIPGLFGNGERILLKAGATGYWAGRFSSLTVNSTTLNGIPIRQSYGQMSYVQIWCFFGSNDKGKAASACVQLLEDGRAEYIITGRPYLLKNFSVQGASEVLKFSFQEKEVEVLPDLRMEYRFVEWDTKDVDVDFMIQGVWIDSLPAQREADGSALLETPAGNLRLRPLGSDRLKAMASLEQPSKPAEKVEAPARLDQETLQKTMLGIAQIVEAEANRLDNSVPTRMQVATPAQIDPSPRPIRAGEVVARQTIRPVRAFTQDTSPLNRPTRFGPPGALLFQVSQGNDPTMLCWRNPEQMAQTAPDQQQNRVQSYCLEDYDKDGRYEVLWKNPVFAEGTRYLLQGRSSRTVLNQPDSPPISVQPADPSLLPPETIELVYLGVSDEKLNETGAVIPESLKFQWRYATFPGGSPEITGIFMFEVNVSKEGSGQYHIGDQPVLIVRDVKADSNPNLQVQGFYPLGDVDLQILAERAKDMRAFAQKLREGAKAPAEATTGATASAPSPAVP
ncbi:hypothetical protein [Aquidulcibacter sp.]|uniref:hypothetical protein n=1 Tax=Aquidulcibacter sp. TaxID=2052990 RepID=UPI0025C25875|nr:hypothetical protein [Aquidulcibacter sp.]MCA3693928.1 hypothetical protein [Aquidulcibacter sp.]